MAEAIVITAALRDEIAADLEAGGERAARWRPAPPDHRFTPVLVLQGADRAGQDAIGHVGEVRGMSTVDGYPNVTEVAVLMPGEWFADAAAWAPVGGVDSGPRPDIGDRILIRDVRYPDIEGAAIGQIATVDEIDNLTGRVAATLTDGRTVSYATRWAILPPEVPAEVHALPTEPGPALGATPGDPTRLGPHDMYELAIRIPMAAFTGAPNEDPRIDQLVDLAMGLFPGSMATGGPAWPEDGPTQCPTCGAVDRHERRHRAHEDAETTLRELVRWLAGQRDRAHDRRYDDYGLILGYLRDQGLDVETPHVREGLATP